MSIENTIDVLNFLQKFRSQLEVWGVTQQFLMGLALVSGIFFIFSAREVVGWLLRVPHMRGEIKALRSQVNDLQETLNKLNANLEKTSAVEDFDHSSEKNENSEADKKVSGRPQFRLDH